MHNYDIIHKTPIITFLHDNSQIYSQLSLTEPTVYKYWSICMCKKAKLCSDIDKTGISLAV